MRKLLFILPVLFCSSAYAIIVYPPPVEKSKEGFHLGLQTIYSQSIFNTETATTNVGPALIPNTWSFGYKIQLSYLFQQNFDLNVNWLHFSSNIDQTLQNNNNLNGQYTVNQFGTGQQEFKDATESQIDNLSTNIQNKINMVNFEFGRSKSITERLKVRLQIGLQYANINQDIYQVASNTTISSEFNYNDGQLDTTFNGVGPRAGFDTTYILGGGFCLANSFAYALPTGTLSINDTAHQSNKENTAIGTLSTASYHAIKTIFDYSESLSLRYQQQFMDSLWGFDIGYQISDYDIAGQSGVFVGLRVIH